MDRRDVPLCIALLGLAFLVRLPYVQLVPRFTDEFDEVLWAWRIAHEGFRPLTHNSSHIGIVFPYLLAALLRLLGPSIELPRLFVAIFGACLAPATYAIGRLVTSRPAAFLAGFLVAVSSALVLMSSHIAYSSSLTPFFVTSALLVTTGAWSKQNAWLWPISGIAWGLALQTHPAAVPWLAGTVVAIVCTAAGRRSLRTLWPWLALVGVALGYANMIRYNLTTDFGTLRSIRANPGYYGRPATTPLEYLARLTLLLSTLTAAAAGVPDLTVRESVAPILAVSVMAILGVLVWTSRRHRRSLLALALLSAVLLSPIFNARFAYPSGTRYLCSALPPVFVLVSERVVACWGPPNGAARRSPKRPVLFGSVILVLSVPLAWLALTYRHAEATRRTNRSILALAEAAAGPDLPHPVILDSHLDLRKVEGGGRLGGVTRYLLTMRQVPFQVWDYAAIARSLEAGTWPAMVLLRETYEQLAWQCYPRQAELFGLAPAARASYNKFDDVRWSAALFAPASVPMAHSEGSALGDVAMLVGYTWSPNVVRPGERAFLTLFWAPLRSTAKPLSAFVHLTTPDGHRVAQADGWPRDNWFASTVSWRAGRTVEDRHSFVLPEGSPPGSLRASVGLYDTDSGERLSARTADGSPWPENAVQLANALAVVAGPTIAPGAVP